MKMAEDKIKFLTINSKTKWESRMLNKDTDNNNAIQIEESTRLASHKTIVFNSQMSLSNNQIIDVSADNCDFLYILICNDDGSFGIEILNPGTGFSEKIKISSSQPKSIQVGQEFIYLLDGKQVQIISKRNYYSSKIVKCIGEDPCDIAVDKDDNLFLLDKNNTVYILRDEDFHHFLDKNAVDKITRYGSIRCEIGKYDDNLYLLGSKDNVILRLTHDGHYKNEIQFASILEQVVDFDVFDHNNIFIILKNHSLIGKLYDPIKKQDIWKTLGNYDCLATSQNNMLYLFNTTNNHLDWFEHIDRFVSSATYITTPFDSTTNDTIWHKISLDAKIPTNTTIDISYYSSNFSSLPDNATWSNTLSNPFDSLIKAKGRYLWIKLELSSLDGISSPELHNCMVFFPRLTYLKYLPSIYSTDNESKDFLERFLSIFETMQSSVDKKITSFVQYIDPRITPDDFLPWLSTWLGYGLIQKWPKENARRFLELLPELYKNRGTRYGLEQVLSLYLESVKSDVSDASNTDENFSSFFKDGKFTIIESFQLRCAQQGDAWNNFENLYGNDVFSFFILLNPLQVNRKLVEDINKIVEEEKPAHTVAHVIMLDPWFQLNSHTYLGVNTFLKKQILTIGESKLGRDSMVYGRNG